MTRQFNSQITRGAIYLALYAPAVALLFYFLGGILPILADSSSGPGTLFRLYGNFCHQIPNRSFHLASAQMGFCARCAGFYGSLALASLLIAITGRIKPLPWYWLLVLSGPMLFDVIFNLSDHFAPANLLRLISGLIGGTGIALFIYPRLVGVVRYSLATGRDA